jgi:hypothetical protein
MWKFWCFLGLALFLSFSLSAVEVKTVVRDFEYQNIFAYKTHLMGKAKANIFPFEGDVEKKPEYFRVTIKTPEEELGQTVAVIFQYKQQGMNDLKERREKLSLSRKTMSVKFLFPPEDEVEQWAVFLVKEGKIVAEKKSHGNTSSISKFTLLESSSSSPKNL